MDAETLYGKLRQVCEDEGAFISDEADDLLANAARAIAEGTDSTTDLNVTNATDPNRRYAMYSSAGNARCAEVVAPLLAAIRAEAFPRSSLDKQYEDALAEIAKTHQEVFDTEPRGQISQEVLDAAVDVGWRWKR